ncbi:MAG: C45 family peptidase [Planctomycetota bacterium]|nr:C45 family peptidase [Planctomycetota bacterium]
MRKHASIILTLLLCVVLSPAANAAGYRTFVCGTDNDGSEIKIPLVVVKGTPYEMGRDFGRLLRKESQEMIAGFLRTAQHSEYKAFTKEKSKQPKPLRYTDAVLDAAWKATSPHIHERFKEQMRGLADGAEIPSATLRRVYMIPVVSDYSCSGAAIWGKATADGHLYQFRNLDYTIDAGLQNYPVILVSLPDEGIPHVSVTFSGFLGVNTGMNAAGTVLTSMGDSPAKDYPYDLDGAPFYTMFSDLLHDAGSLEQALQIIKSTKRIKKYHYIIANGKDKAGVKIKAHAPELLIWGDNDGSDEVAPLVFENIVYNAESRDPLAVRHIKANYGKYDTQRVIDLTRKVPIRGGNLMAVVYDATALRLWVSYAKGKTEAYKRPFIPLRLGDYLKYRTDGENVVERVD